MADSLTIQFNEGQCQEGCGEATAKGRRFLQGHDARLKSKLYAAVRADESVKVNGKTVKPSDVITGYGWPQPAPKRARKAKPKADKTAGKPKGSTAKRKTTGRKPKVEQPAA
jgi:hypothetical protein